MALFILYKILSGQTTFHDPEIKSKVNLAKPRISQFHLLHVYLYMSSILTLSFYVFLF